MTIIQAHNTQALRAEIERYIATSRPQATSRDLTNLYQTAPSVYAVSNYRATNVAAVKMLVKDKKSGETLDPTNPAAAIFERGYYNFMYRSEVTNYFWGRNLLYIQRNMFGNPVQMRWINPNMYDVDTTSRHGLRSFRIYHAGSNYQTVTDEPRIYPRDAVYMNGLDFDDDYDGVAEAEVAFLAGGMTVEAATTAFSFFRNMAIPAAIAQPEAGASTPSEPDKNALTAFLRRTFQGAMNAGRVLVSPSRWQWIILQSKFDDLAMPELIKSAREDVFIVSGTPMVLVLSGASSYAEFEGARRAWLQNWLVPRLWLYAGIFTEQLARQFGDYVVEPDLNSIPGLKEDKATLVNTTNAQVQGGYMTLADAQRATGVEKVDTALEGLYLINGVLYHRTQLEALQRPATILLPDSTPPEQTPPPQEPKQVDDQPHPLPPRPKSDGYVSDEVFAELKNWEAVYARKGTKRDFEFQFVRVDVEKRVKVRLEEATTPEMLKAAFDYARELSAQKAVQATRLDFENAFNNLLEGARRGDYTRQQFQSQLRKVLRQYGVMAYRDGLVDGGVTDGELDDEDRAEVATLLAEQSDYISSFGSVLFNKDGISDNLADLKAELWWNKTVNKFYQHGLASADRNGMYMWVIGQTEKHCVTCAALNNQVHRMKEYAKRGLLPKSSNLVCGGWYCDCNLVKVNERARGTFPRYATGRSHQHTHGEAAEPITQEEFDWLDMLDGMDDSHLLVIEGAPDEPEKVKHDDA